jgi:hypothetical protein
MKIKYLVGALALAFAGSANAALVTFFGEDLNPGLTVPAGGNAENARNAFLSNLVGVGTETFEGFALGTGTPLAISFPGSVGAITATISGNGLVENNAGGAGSGGNAFGRFNTTPGGSQYWEASSVFTIAFSAPISAFGFYATDIGDFNGQVTLQASNGVVTNLVIPNTVLGPDGSLLFYGFIDTVNSYTSIVFGNTAAGVDFFGFDDMIIGDRQQVRTPEPFTGALLGAGLLGLALCRRRVRA